MTLLTDTCRAVRKLDTAIYQQISSDLAHRTNVDGLMADLAARYGAITKDDAPTVPRKCLILAAADHGVAELGISAYPVETTVEMTKNYLIAHGAGANALANFAHADMVVVDVGIASDVSDIPGLIHKKIAYGTRNFTTGPAMTREEAVRALEVGIALVRDKVREGYRSFSLGEMGIGNTTSSAAICAAFTGLTAEAVTGRGTGISDARMLIKTKAVADALKVNRPDPTDGLDVLAKVGGYELGCLAGACLGAGAYGAVVIIDGFNASAAAMIATALAPNVRDYMIGSHLSAEQAHVHMLRHLGLKPSNDMGLRLGEGTGASIAQGMLDIAISLYTGEQAVVKTATTLHTGEQSAESSAQQAIRPLDNASCDRCRLLIDNLSKPLGSLGMLEQFAVRLAGIREEMRPPKQGKQRLCVFSPTASPAIRKMAHATKTEVQTISHHGDIAYGISLAESASRDGIRMIGIALADDTDIDAMTGLILGAASRRIAVFLDSRASLLAAENAINTDPLCRDYLFTAHLPQEETVRALMHTLGLPAPLHLDLSAEKGLGAMLGFMLMHGALHMLNDMKTFGEAGVTIAKDGPGTQRQKQDIKGDTI
jgi:nicotinate-nucleotide--dimethylbenzimidazole phosphoribosyltransferase